MDYRKAQVIRFLSGGGLATLVHWSVMFALIRIGFDAVLATTIGATAGLAINYLVQYRYTFRSGLKHQVAFSRYLTSASLGWALNLTCFTAAYAATGSSAFSQILATGAMTFANYLLADRFVFREE